jgi:DNA-binding beta-propeller fold protein YncE
MQTDTFNIYNQNTESDFRFFARLSDGRGLLSCHALNAVLVVNSGGDVIGQLSEGIAKPEGIAVNSKGFVYVVDRHNNCIHVYDENLIHQRGILTDFQEPGKLNQPVGIAISKVDDRIYVADNENHRVLALTADGKYISTLAGSSGIPFFCPCGLALFNHPVHGELIIVSEWGGGRVQVFKTSGALFALYGGVEHAHHVVVDNDGIIYVSEYSTRKIKKFNINGDLLGGSEWGNSAVSIVAANGGGVDSVVMRNQVVMVIKDCKRRRRDMELII